MVHLHSQKFHLKKTFAAEGFELTTFQRKFLAFLSEICIATINSLALIGSSEGPSGGH